MRVTQLQQSASHAAAPRRPRAGDGRFEVADAAAPDVARVRMASPVAGVDALVALQAVDDSGERSRKAVDRGHETLDLLDDLKLAVLSGAVTPAALARLERAVARGQDLTADPELRDILAQIDLRAQVELAKLQRGRAA